MSMTRSEHLLLIFCEECLEVGQRITKALRFSLTEVQKGQLLNNAERIVGELHDLIAVAKTLETEGAIENIIPDDVTIKAKLDKIEDYFAISRERGTLVENSPDYILANRPDYKAPIQEAPIEAPHGWVVYNDGPQETFWTEMKPEPYELSDGPRPATQLEKFLFNRIGNSTECLPRDGLAEFARSENGDLDPQGWEHAKLAYASWRTEYSGLKAAIIAYLKERRIANNINVKEVK